MLSIAFRSELRSVRMCLGVIDFVVLDALCAVLDAELHAVTLLPEYDFFLISAEIYG